jgi:hypothetical protein
MHNFLVYLFFLDDNEYFINTEKNITYIKSLKDYTANTLRNPYNDVRVQWIQKRA